MADQFVGEIRIVPFNFAPNGWALCNGQLMAISQNTALFSLLGTQFGGDGRSNFALPNLQAKVPMDFGDGPGLTPRNVGDSGGTETVGLLTNQIAKHAHGLNYNLGVGVSETPSQNLPAIPAVAPRFGNLYATGAGGAAMLAGTLKATGGSAPHNNLQPYLTLNFVIALQGIFPSRG